MQDSIKRNKQNSVNLILLLKIEIQNEVNFQLNELYDLYYKLKLLKL